MICNTKSAVQADLRLLLYLYTIHFDEQALYEKAH